MKNWYLEQNPEAIDESVEIIEDKIEEFKIVLDNITEDMIRAWVEELIFIKTPDGLNYEIAIMEKLANKYDVEYTNSTAKEESKNIDGYLNSQPVSVKPYSHKHSSASNIIDIDIPIIYYKITDNYLYTYYDEDKLDFS